MACADRTRAIVRPPRPDELAALLDIEVEAGRRFADIGMASVAEDDPGSVAELSAVLTDGRLWVAVDDADRPVGYAVAREVGGRGHLEQVSVRPERQGQGLGRALVDTVADWARARGHHELTLSTFRDVEWNAPLYRHLGFGLLTESEVDAALLDVRREEVAHGLDVSARVLMVRPLVAPRFPDPAALPAGCTARALRPDDARAVHAVVAASEVHDLGSPEVDPEDIVADWQRPSFHLDQQSVGIECAGVLVAQAEVHEGWRADAHVVPQHRGRGIGTWLASWVQAEAARESGTVVGMSVPQGSDGDQLLAALGFHVRWTSWVLALPAGSVIAPQPLPPGYAVRDLRAGDEPSAYRIVEDAFGEWPDRVPTVFEDWAAATVRRPGFDPTLLRLVTGPGRTPVAVCLLVIAEDCAYVAQLAVCRDHRGLGLARALLADAFERGRTLGATRSELSTDSRTGALGLYEKIGMVVTSTWVHRGIRLAAPPARR
jgi:GNAT superfamily N-acetyltransferase